MREMTGGRLVADLLVTAGIDRVLTTASHFPPGARALQPAADVRRHDLADAEVVSPDLGHATSAAAVARRLGMPVTAGAGARLTRLVQQEVLSVAPAIAEAIRRIHRDESVGALFDR